MQKKGHLLNISLTEGTRVRNDFLEKIIFEC